MTRRTSEAVLLLITIFISLSQTQAYLNNLDVDISSSPTYDQILFKVLHKDEDNTNSQAEYIKYKRNVVDLNLKIPDHQKNSKQKRDLASVLYQALHQDVEEGEQLSDSEHTVSLKFHIII